MEIEGNYEHLRKKIDKAKKHFTHYIYRDNSGTVGEMCHLQGYIEAYRDLGLVTKEQFNKLDNLI